MSWEISIPAGRGTISGTLQLPKQATALVLFAHGSGSSRHSPRNRFVATLLQEKGLATLLFDLLTREEESVDAHTGQYRFDIDLLANRLVDVTHWTRSAKETAGLPIGYFGSSTGGGAALVAAAELGHQVAAVVSRGGRPDLAKDALPRVLSPTLLIVGGNDPVVLDLNRDAMRQMKCEVFLEEVPGATHLFEEPGALEQVARSAGEWFITHSVRQPVKH